MHQRNLIKTLSALVALFATSLASAETYYVDSQAGRDSNDGLAATQSAAATGPWRSLAKVASAPLAAGDVVLLKCGQRWNETLKLSGSGSATAPIEISSFPAGCTNKPIIDGSLTLPSAGWSSTSTSGKWVASWPPSVIVNGKADLGVTAPWSSWSDAGNHKLYLSSTCPTAGTCLALEVGSARQHALAISNSFPVTAGQSVRIGLTYRLPAGHSANVVVRRNAAPWETLGLAQTLTGNGNWQTITATFTSTETVNNARLDLELRPGNGPLIFDDVAIVPSHPLPLEVHVGSVLQNPAHHPNAGHLSAAPTSVYLPIPADAPYFQHPQRATNVSTSFTLPTTLGLPGGASLTPGLGVNIRSRSWAFEENAIRSMSGSTVTLRDSSLFALQQGWGFFLTGAGWMVDSPAEWFADSTTGRLILATHDGAVPAGRVTATVLDRGIDLSNQSYVVVRNLRVQKVGTGVVATNSKNVQIDGLSISRTAGFGVDFLASREFMISNSEISDTRLDALSGTQHWKTSAIYAVVRDNLIVGSGTNSSPTDPERLPAPALASLHAGTYATVHGNTLVRSAYTGIRADKGSVVSGNHVVDSCLVLDDGGGIYVQETDNDGLIENNVVENVIGRTDGKPRASTQAVGIYLDDLTSGVTVRQNTVSNADNGIQVHNAFNNVIENNTLFGNRVNQLWFQENWNRLNPAGDIYGNEIRGNLFVPTTPVPALYQLSEFSFPSRFATYAGNLYSGLLTSVVAMNSWKDAAGEWQNVSYTYPQWESSVLGNTGVAAALAATDNTYIAPKAYAQYRVTGTSILPTLVIDTGPDGWKTWTSATAPAPISYASCPNAPCIRAAAGTADSILISPNFSTTKDQWYRLSFDLRTSAAGQKVDIVIRRGGGGQNGFSSLMGSPISVTGNGQWKRHAFIFKANNTVVKNNPATLDNGARVDFGGIKPGQALEIGRLDLVPISSVEESTQIRLISNPESSAQYIECPDAELAPANCSKYVDLRTEQPISWPATLLAHESIVVFTQERSLLDSDQDGIPDSQDSCGGTTAGLAVDASGCP